MKTFKTLLATALLATSTSTLSNTNTAMDAFLESTSTEKIAEKHIKAKRTLEMLDKSFEKDRINRLISSAKRGRIYDQVSLGDMYFWGRDIKQDYSQAIKWYKKAAEQQGNPYSKFAIFNVAEMYHHGLGVTQNYDKAFEWYEKLLGYDWLSNTQENALKLAAEFRKQLEQKGNKLYQTPPLELWTSLAEQGNVVAQHYLYNVFTRGWILEKNSQQALRWLKKAAEQGYYLAQYELGYKHDIGVEVPRNYSLAFNWYQKSAEQGYARAQESLGGLYRYGHGVRQDKAKAIYYYGLACDNGYQLGCDYYRELNSER